MPQRSPFPFILPLGLLLCAGIGVRCVPARAQVSTSQNALDALGGGRDRHPAPSGHPAAHRAAPARHAAAPRHQAPPRPPARTAGRAAPAATIEAAPPPPPAFRAPVVNVPLHPPPPPPPVPVVQDAVGAASSLPDGTRITFGSNSADLDPATMAALHGFADRLKADPALRADLDADAAGGSDDPSTPRRVALSRGLAARAVLINDGIASTRIYVRVLGPVAPGGDAPADRVDLRAVGTGTAENPGGPPATGLPQPSPVSGSAGAVPPSGQPTG